MCYHVSTAAKEKFDAYAKDYNVVNYAFNYYNNGFDHLPTPITIDKAHKDVITGPWGIVAPNALTVEEAKMQADTGLNARSDKIHFTKFKQFYTNRCLVWVDGFYEWQWQDEKGKEKWPHYIYMPDHIPFTMGGIYSEWVHPETGEVLTTWALVMTEANELLAKIHNNAKRMPVIIAAEDREQWLTDHSKDGWKQLTLPFPDGIMQAHTISKLITNKRDNPDQPAVQEPFEYNKTNLF